MISYFDFIVLNSAKMRAHDCPYRVVNGDHMQISFEAKMIFVQLEDLA